MAGSKTNVFETDILELVFNNTALPNIGDSSGLQPSSTEGSLYVALYTVAPTDSTSGTECNYTGYGRVGVVRSSSGWTVANGTVTNTANIVFGECTAGTNTAIAWGILTASTSGTLLYWGNLTSSLAIASTVIPGFPAGALSITED